MNKVRPSQFLDPVGRFPEKNGGCDHAISAGLLPSPAATLFATGECTGRALRGSRFRTRHAPRMPLFNRSITLFIIDKISCGNAKIRAFAVHFRRIPEMLRKEHAILRRAFAGAAARSAGLPRSIAHCSPAAC
jgi:hypothetical protein